MSSALNEDINPVIPTWAWGVVGATLGIDVVLVLIALIYTLKKGGGCIFCDKNERKTLRRNQYIS